jgi:hypothetical protein
MIKRGGYNNNNNNEEKTNEEKTNEEFNLRMKKCKEKRNREIQRFISNRIAKEKSNGKIKNSEESRFINTKISDLSRPLKNRMNVLTKLPRLSDNQRIEKKSILEQIGKIKSPNGIAKIKEEYYKKVFEKVLLSKYIYDYKTYNMGDGNNNNFIDPNKFTYRHVPQCHSLFNPYGSEPNNKVNNAKVNNARINNAKVNDPKQNKQPSSIFGSMFGKTGGNSKKRSSKKAPVKKPSSKKALVKKTSSKK